MDEDEVEGKRYGQGQQEGVRGIGLGDPMI